MIYSPAHGDTAFTVPMSTSSYADYSPRISSHNYRDVVLSLHPLAYFYAAHSLASALSALTSRVLGQGPIRPYGHQAVTVEWAAKWH